MGGQMNGRQTDRQTDRLTDRWTERQTIRHTHRHAHKTHIQTDKPIIWVVIILYICPFYYICHLSVFPHPNQKIKVRPFPTSLQTN